MNCNLSDLIFPKGQKGHLILISWLVLEYGIYNSGGWRNDNVFIDKASKRKF